jgi:general L-amino acid transport system substrate-binding protein
MVKVSWLEKVQESLHTNGFKNGISVCTNTGTTTELNMRDFFNARGISYEPVAFEEADEVVQAYDAGRCDTYTTDKSGLAAQRTKMKNPDEHIVLPETISKEPLGPAVDTVTKFGKTLLDGHYLQ